MNQHVALDSALATSTPKRNGAVGLLALCSLVVAVVAIAAALISDRSLTPEQRFQVFLQSGLYP